MLINESNGPRIDLHGTPATVLAQEEYCPSKTLLFSSSQISHYTKVIQYINTN